MPKAACNLKAPAGRERRAAAGRVNVDALNREFVSESCHIGLRSSQSLSVPPRPSFRKSTASVLRPPGSAPVCKCSRVRPGAGRNRGVSREGGLSLSLRTIGGLACRGRRRFRVRSVRVGRRSVPWRTREHIGWKSDRIPAHSHSPRQAVAGGAELARSSLSATARISIFAKIFKDLGNSAVMTVGEANDFIDRGGMIRFTFEQDKVRFEINLKAADAAGLKFSSRLLLLATNVFGKQG